MGKKSTATKNKWNAQNYDQVRLVVKKGQKEIIQKYAEEMGYKSLNAYINELIADDMEDRLNVENESE